MEIVKLVIKGGSGYGPIDEAYNDKLTISSNSNTYEYIPAVILTDDDYKS